MTVRYSGILPDLFREGQGIIAMGSLDQGGQFEADEVLAKHDENYMPPEVADALKMAAEGGSIASPHAKPLPLHRGTASCCASVPIAQVIGSQWISC